MGVGCGGGGGGCTPLVGLALGAPLGHTIGPAADYVAIGVLLAFGLYKLVSDEDEEQEQIARLAGSVGDRR